MGSNKKYQPSNGTEGMYFTEKYCMNCLHCDPDPEGEKQCDILFRSMAYSITDKEYPEEWTFNEEDQPICTNHQKWDWGNDDDGKNEPPEPPTDDPNQLMLFSIADDILENHIVKELKEV